LEPRTDAFGSVSLTSERFYERSLDGVLTHRATTFDL